MTKDKLIEVLKDFNAYLLKWIGEKSIRMEMFEAQVAKIESKIKEQSESWQQIEQDFIKWDNETHSNASQRQVLDWFKERFEK